MKRRLNLPLWTGFLLIAVGLFSYVPFFAMFPITRDFPWANLLFLTSGAILLAIGLKRAFQQSLIYRGKIVGCLLALLSAAGIGLFIYGLVFQARDLPPATGAPRVGEKAPAFSLPDQNNEMVTLAGLLSGTGASGAKPKGALLIFYRGHW